MLHEKSSRMGNDWQFERGAQWDTLAKLADQGVDRCGVGATLLHRTVVNVKMTREPDLVIAIGFFGKHDLVDETAGLRIDRW